MWWVKHIIRYFKQVDPILYSLCLRITLSDVTPGKNFFAEICEMIINQQLSEKAGSTIWKRFLLLLPNPTPKKLLATSDDTIRAVGISRSKVSYLKNLAKYAQTFNLQRLARLHDNEVITELTKIKGIGPWTAEMFLMFTLRREDVFSYGDLGLKNAIKKHYNFKSDPTRIQIEKLANTWKPYRTYAARILWKSLDLS